MRRDLQSSWRDYDQDDHEMIAGESSRRLAHKPNSITIVSCPNASN